jgi:hypothetical protein
VELHQILSNKSGLLNNDLTTMALLGIQKQATASDDCLSGLANYGAAVRPQKRQKTSSAFARGEIEAMGCVRGSGLDILPQSYTPRSLNSLVKKVYQQYFSCQFTSCNKVKRLKESPFLHSLFSRHQRESLCTYTLRWRKFGKVAVTLFLCCHLYR